MQLKIGFKGIILPALFLLNLCLSSASGDDWSLSCASNCTCKWTNGKKSAICSSLQLSTIPTTLSTELQVLVLNNNHIPYLNREEFTSLGLSNLQRIYLKKSEVQYIHKEAFRNLKILVEIDLSDNKIEMLDKDTFMGNDRLRILYLNGNPLKRLAAYQFPILPHLRTLDLHDCFISHIDPMALANLNLLEFLYLKNNLLESLSEYVFQHMANLKTLVLDENPWQCDCRLRKFRKWYINSKLNSVSLMCKGPLAHKNKLWDDVDDKLFGCSPKVEIFNNEDVQNIDIGSNTTFSCLVYGDPLPDVFWELNGKILDNDNVLFDTENIASDKLWSNLTVFNMSSLDAGTYACTGSNVIATVTQNISIYLTEIVQHVLVKTPETFWYFGLIVGTFGTIFLLISISFVVCLCKRTTRHRRHPNKSGVKTSVSFNDQEKKLLDLSITTTTNDRGDSCGIDNNTTSMSKTDSIIGFDPIEIHAVENHRTGHTHTGLVSGSHNQIATQQQSQLQNQLQLPQHMHLGSSGARQQLMAVNDGSRSVVGIPTSAASVNNSHSNQIFDEFPLNVGVFPPPPEFCSNIVPQPTFGNIFISVSVTQDMLDGTDINMYPDLLNIPKRIHDIPMPGIKNGANVNCSTADSEIHISSTANISPFATLPRHTPRRGILKKDISLQQQQTNVYPQDILEYHNTDSSCHEEYTTSKDQKQKQSHCANNIVNIPQPPLLPAVTAVAQCHHQTATSCATTPKNCVNCISTITPITSSCSSPPIDANPLRSIGKNAINTLIYPKYDNMGRRITASGNSTLSLPDEERTETERLFNECTLISQQPLQKVQPNNNALNADKRSGEYVSL